jgi:exopolysaccharide biosynthesis polyprenyl glycosylphosphotransferase
MRFFRGIAGSLLAGLGLAAILFTVFPGFPNGYSGGLAAWLLSVTFIAALRPILRALVRRHRLVDTLVILGPDEMAEKLYRELETGDSVVRRHSVASPEDPEPSMSQGRVSRIVVTDPEMLRMDLPTLIDSKLRGLKIEQAVESCEHMCGKIWIEGLKPEWWIYSGGFAPTRSCRIVKKIVDFAGAVFLTVLLAPLMALTAALIKLTSKGPVLYCQERVGLNGKPFMVRKFRSMYADAESASGPAWAKPGDSRITPLGRFLRKFRIDELPQLFNILRGEMSFVGPRPERPYFVELLKGKLPYYDLRHYVRPGITGWAQVMYPYGSSVADSYQKLQYDLYYSKHMSLVLDLTILLKTIKVVLSGEGR